MAQTQSSQFHLLTDYFDLIPDEILLSILNKIIDSKSLVRCLVLSRRFSSLVPQVESLSITIPHHHDHQTPRKNNTGLSRIRNIVRKPMVRILNRIIRFRKIDRAGENKDDNSFNVVNGWINGKCSLKNFSNVRSLRLVLPPNRLSDSDDHFLHWTAEFGKELRRCTIVAADSITPIISSSNEGIKNDCNDDPVVPSEDLKRKLLCIISTLLAASARHTLIKRIVTTSPQLISTTISDARDEGNVIMDEEGIVELRDWMSGIDDKETMVLRTCLPDVTMRVWCAEELVLEESGRVLKGAIVATVKATAAAAKEVEVKEEEKGIVWEVVREMRKCRRKKGLRLEMNSF